MIQERVLLPLLASLVFSGCGGLASHAPKRAQTTASESTAEGVLLRKLERKAYAQPSPSRCAAKQIVRLFALTNRYPTTADWLDVQRCCGPTPPFDELRCKRDAVTNLTKWFQTLPGDLRTGKLGMAAVAVPKPPVMCVLRLSPLRLRFADASNGYEWEPERPTMGHYVRTLTAQGQVQDRPVTTLKVSPIKDAGPASIVSLEIRHMDAERAPANVISALFTPRQCEQTTNPSRDASLTDNLVLNYINIERAKQALTPLEMNTKWQRPLEVWLERAEELGLGGSIPGVLDKRGWSVPRAHYARMSATTDRQFQTLLRFHPTLRLLVSDPHMTSVSVGTVDGATGTEWIVGFFQDSSKATAQDIQFALFSDLNRIRDQLGKPHIRRHDATDQGDGDLMECLAAKRHLANQVHKPSSSVLWTAVQLNHSQDFSIPSCQLRFGWVP